MKSKVLVFFVLALTFFMAACTDSDVYTNVIPNDASLVISANFKQMAEKGELTSEDGKMLADNFVNSIRKELSETEAEIFNKVLANPEETGLDLQKNIYIFATPKMEYSAVLASVSDYEKLNTLTDVLVSQNVCGTFAEENGFRSSVVNDKSVMIYNDKVFLVVFSESEKETSSDKLKEIALGWFSNEKNNSYVVTEEYKKLSVSKADIVIAGSLVCIPEEQARLLTMNLPQNISLKDIAGVFAINFEKGKLQIDIESLYKSDEAKEQVKKSEKVYAGKIRGKFLDKFVSNSMFYGSFTCDGEELYSMLMENEIFKYQLESARMPFSLEKVLGSLDGEISIAIAKGEALPQIALYAEVDNDDILKELKDYEAALKLAQIKYGVEDDSFFISNMKEPKSGESFDDVESGKASKGKLAYLTIDFKALSDVVKLLGGRSQARQIDMVAGYLKSITMYNDDTSHSHIIFSATDSETNVLKQIVDNCKKMSGI